MPKKTVVNLTRLEQLMQAKKWGIGELANYSGVKYDTVYSLVKGRRPNSNAATLKSIADALETSVDYLLGLTEGRELPAESVPLVIRRLAEIASELSEVRQEELLRIAATLAELEREYAQRPVSQATLRALVELSEELKGKGHDEDLLVVLQSFLQNPPPRWLVDLRRADEPPDEPTNHE